VNTSPSLHIKHFCGVFGTSASVKAGAVAAVDSFLEAFFELSFFVLAIAFFLDPDFVLAFGFFVEDAFFLALAFFLVLLFVAIKSPSESFQATTSAGICINVRSDSSSHVPHFRSSKTFCLANVGELSQNVCAKLKRYFVGKMNLA
jgi:hypothetical protein